MSSAPAHRPSDARRRDDDLVLENRGSSFHTLTISRLYFELRADGGERAPGAFTVSALGTYEFVCSISDLAGAGMRGETQRWIEA